MPNFEVSFYLKSGVSASITFENIISIQHVKQNIEAKMNAAGMKLELFNATNIVSINKDEIVGYSVEQM